MERLTKTGYKFTDKHMQILDYLDKYLIVECLNKLVEYEDLEEQGKLLKLPCAVGDTVYIVEDDCDYGWDCYTKAMCKNCEYRNLHIEEDIFSLSEIALHLNNFGKTVFITREEAEAALKEMEGKK